MATLTIDGVGTELQRKLAALAEEHGSSIPQEALRVIADALHVSPFEDNGKAAAQTDEGTGDHLSTRVRALVEKYGPLDIDLPAREKQREPPDFGEWTEE